MRQTYLLRELVRRDLAGRYRGSLLGFLWAFLTPVWQLALYTLVFSFILRVPLIAEGTSSFPICPPGPMCRSRPPSCETMATRDRSSPRPFR